jgi:hypothetical protein
MADVDHDAHPVSGQDTPTTPAGVAGTTSPPVRRAAQPPDFATFCQREAGRQLGDAEHPAEMGAWRRRTAFAMGTLIPSGLASAALHLLLLIGLALTALNAQRIGDLAMSVFVTEASVEAGSQEPLQELVLDVPPADKSAPPEPLPEADLGEPLAARWPEQQAEQLNSALQKFLEERQGTAPPGRTANASPVLPSVPIGPITVGRDAHGGLGERRRRRVRATEFGATAGSERAVDGALRWLVRHQAGDGSWNFDHRSANSGCPQCVCRNPGTSGGENGATGLALLALLGGGHTASEGEFREPVSLGLRYLIAHQDMNGNLMDSYGRMYSHGIATLALCEALGMMRYESGSPTGPGNGDAPAPPDSPAVSAVTRAMATAAGPAATAERTQPHAPRGSVTDAELAPAARKGMAFIESAQHPAGGWRYSPGDPGDTSVVGWQLMALKSGYMAGLKVDPRVIQQSQKFLDFAADDRIGSCYGYTTGRRAAKVDRRQAIGPTTPIGLLCRMYTGWDRSQSGLVEGVDRLSGSARADRGLYFYYYATQVLHHYGGKPWTTWNQWMRDYLVHCQANERAGTEAGSWHLRGPHDVNRLYCTALAAMTLEVYYRYSPIYGEDAVGGEPLASPPTVKKEPARKPAAGRKPVAKPQGEKSDLDILAPAG